MKLVFDLNNESSELKDILGFVDADILFSEMKADLKSATRALIHIIGKDTYQEISDNYEDGDESNNDEVLEQTRYVIALGAYISFAPNRDLAHTPQGRKMRVDNNEKAAFEWMLDRSNEQLERKYHKGIDELLIILDDSDTWKESMEYQKMHSSWVSDTMILKEFYPQGTRYLLLNMAPALRRSQSNDIKSRLKKDIYDSINTQLKKGDTISNEIESNILNRCREIMVNKALASTLLKSRVTIFPEGILQAYTGDRNTTKPRQVPIAQAIELTALSFDNQAKQLTIELEEYLAALEPKPGYVSRTGYIANNNDNFISL